MNRFHRWFCRTSIWKKALENEIIPWALKDVELGDDVLEVGPGPGMTTDILRERASRLTSIEIDPRLADSLRQRMQGTAVTVVGGDATAMPFAAGAFSGAGSVTMRRQRTSAASQDPLLAALSLAPMAGRVLPGSDTPCTLAL